MRGPLLYAVGLVAVFAVALGGGRALAPVVDVAAADAPHDDGAQADDAAHAAHADESDGGHLEEATVEVTGLAVSQGGLTLVPDRRTLDPGQSFSFAITGEDGAALTAFDETHTEQLHLVVASRDLAEYRHVHPTLGDDGTWTADLGLDEPGAYRAFADFLPTGGEAAVLGVDLTVPGDVRPQPLPEPAEVTEVDGYEVRLDGDVAAGRASDVRLTVTRDGEPVADLEPYLGAYGHLVALREGDLAYLHVHPEELDAPPTDGTVPFVVEVPSPGRYRLFLDFAHDGEVRTSAHTLEVSP